MADDNNNSDNDNLFGDEAAGRHSLPIPPSPHVHVVEENGDEVSLNSESYVEVVGETTADKQGAGAAGAHVLPAAVEEDENDGNDEDPLPPKSDRMPITQHFSIDLESNALTVDPVEYIRESFSESRRLSASDMSPIGEEHDEADTAEHHQHHHHRHHHISPVFPNGDALAQPREGLALAQPPHRPSATSTTSAASSVAQSVFSSDSSVGGSGVPMPTMRRGMSPSDLRASYSSSFFDQKAETLRYGPLIPCPVCENGKRAPVDSCESCFRHGYTAQMSNSHNTSLMELECVMMMDTFYNEVEGRFVTMEEMTNFRNCMCARDFQVNNSVSAGGNLYDHSRRGEPMKIPFIAPVRTSDHPADELDLTILNLYGIHISVPTLAVLTSEWEDRWVEAWGNSRIDILEAARKKDMAKRLLRQGSGDQVDTEVCQRLRQMYCPRPMEFSYSGDWNSKNQRHGEGEMKWQIFVTAGDKAHRWQFSYNGSWKEDKRHGRGVMKAHPVLSDGVSPGTVEAHTFVVEAVWRNGVRLWTPTLVDTAGLEKDVVVGMTWPTHRYMGGAARNGEVEMLNPTYTGSFYEDGSRKEGALKVHVGMPPLAQEAAFANADYHEYYSRREMWPARSEYEGQWLHNQRCGYGTMKWKWDGHRKDSRGLKVLFKAEYSGLWRENLRDTTVQHDHSDMANLHPLVTQEELANKHTSRSGRPVVGTMMFRNGDRYCGGWKEDKLHGYGVFSAHNRPANDPEYAAWSPKARKLIMVLKHARNRECAIGGVADEFGMFKVTDVLQFTKHLMFIADDGSCYYGFTADDIEQIRREHRKDQPLRFRCDDDGKVIAVGCFEPWDTAFVARNNECGGRWEGECVNGEKHGHITEEMRGGNFFVGRYEHGKRNGFGTFFWRRLSAPTRYAQPKKEAPLAHQAPLLIRKYVGQFSQHLMHSDGGFEGLLAWYEAAAEGPAALEGDSTVPEATVVILRLNGQKFTLSIAHIETVGELKHLVAEETGVPADKMMLYSAPLDKHYRLVDSHKLLDDEPDGYKYGTGRDTTILMWESLVDDDNKLRFPNDAVMSWVDYTSSPYNAAVKLPALSSLGRLLTGRSSVTSGGWGICGTWLPVQISKKDISDKCKSDVVPTRSGMFIERQYRPGLKKVQAISIPYWVLMEDASTELPWFVVKMEGAWWRGKIIHAKCTLRKALPYGAPVDSPREDRIEYIFFDIPGVSIRLNGAKIKEVEPPELQDIALIDDPCEALDTLISSLVIEGRSGHGHEDWDAQDARYYSLDDWSRLARKLKWVPDPVESEDLSEQWFAKIRIDKNFYEYHSKVHNDEDGHDILGGSVSVPTSQITYAQLLRVVLDELHNKCHVLGLVKEERETHVIPPPDANGGGYYPPSPTDDICGEAEPVHTAFSAIRHGYSWKSEKAFFVPHGAKRGARFYGSDTKTQIGSYRMFDLHLDGPFL
eukprot:m.168190 g.168190  ORF g.168190 m.168190 type:complete len:1448 (+) comp12927_c0_seq1:183-4526(+)